MTVGTTAQKRLGDGFYEQKLLREQVAQLTGRRFLTGYASDEVQYRALMSGAVTVAQSWHLIPGVALTPAQIAQLTSDIVWLVERDVKLADLFIKGYPTAKQSVFVEQPPPQKRLGGKMMKTNSSTASPQNHGGRAH